MNEILTVIIDVSGSFAENGKIEIVRALRLSAIRLAKKFGADSEFFIWREDVQPLATPKEIIPRGKNEVSALIEFISACPEGAKILLLSDGDRFSDDGSRIKSAATSRKINLAFVAVGADAGRSKNCAVSTVGDVWSPADLPSAIQAVLFGDAS